MLNFSDLALLHDSRLASDLASYSSFFSDLLTSSPAHSGESDSTFRMMVLKPNDAFY